MTYWRYWRLSGPPFSSEYTQPLFLGSTVEEAVARVDFLIQHRRSLGSLLGPTGVGKSAILRHCHAHPPMGCDMAGVQTYRLSMMGLQGGELISQLATWLTGNRLGDDLASDWKSLCDYFRAAQREGIQSVLLVDDTETSSTAAEADLSRVLSMSFPLTIVLSIDSQMAGAVSRSLIDRVELQIELTAWEFSQTAEFLAWNSRRLERAEPIFTESAVQRIQQLSGGIVRRIIQLADLALVAGAVSQASYIDAECIDQVAWELPKSYAA